MMLLKHWSGRQLSPHTEMALIVVDTQLNTSVGIFGESADESITVCTSPLK